MRHRIRCLLAILPFCLLLIGSQTEGGQNPFGDHAVTPAGTVSGSGAGGWLPAPIKSGEKVKGRVLVSTSLNVRSGPWGDVVGSLGPNAEVTIVGVSGDWYKIEFNGKTAYVHASWIQREGEGAKPFPHRGWVNSKLGLNVRRVPGGDVVGTLKDQREVEIIGESGDSYKIRWGRDEAFVAKRYIDTDMPSQPAGDGVTPMQFTGYVSADIGLNVRTAPWGSIDTALPNGTAVQVTGKKDDWYRISFNGKERWVHANYIEKQRGGGSPVTSEPSSGGTASGAQIAASARRLVGSKAFRTADVDYGNLACAKVASTALKNAGAISRVHLNVRSLVDDLHGHGWKEVTPPPFQEGDVITWKTYDYTGDGVKDPDTHVGIMCKEGNSWQAMNNSSRLRTPRMSDPYSIGPVTRVLRKVA